MLTSPDHDPADTLVRTHADLVYRTALRLVRDADDAADVTQDALVRIWKKGGAVDADKQRAWCARVARNAALDFLRRRAVRPQTAHALTPEATCAAPLPDASVDATFTREALDAAVAGLEEPYRSLVVLRDVEGLSYREVAEALDLPLNTMKVYLHRARRSLRDALRPAARDLALLP